MKNFFVAILFLSVTFGFSQKKTAVKKEAVSLPEVKRPLNSHGNIASDPNAIHVKGDSAENKMESINVDYSQIFTSVELPAKPLGGIDAFRNKIISSFPLPEVDDPTTATIVARFVVWDDGSIRDIMIVKESPSGLGLGKEFGKLLSKSEKWTPAQVNGKNVKQYYTFPLKIQIPAFEETSQPIEETKAKSDAKLIKENDEEARIRKYGHQPEESSVEDTSVDYSQIFVSVHEQAVPPGGMNEFRKNIASSFKLPEVTEKTIATIVAKFVVWDDGSIRDIKIVKESPENIGLGKETIRVLSSSDKWEPGVVNGRKVKQYFTLPIAMEMVPQMKIKTSPKN